MALMTEDQQIVFMTGATSGFGKIAACEIAAKGARVIITCRNEEKKTAFLNFYKKKYPLGKGDFDIVSCNLSSFDSVSLACNQIKSKYDRIDTVINNAGIMNFSCRKTENGIEETLQVNLLSAVLISHMLIGLLERSAEAKLIFTASALHKGNIHFDDMEFNKKFISYKSYSQSKLGIILLTRLWAKQLSKSNIGVYCQHPGLVNTELGRSAGWLSRLFFRTFGKSPKEGVKTLIYLTETPKSALVSGEYYARQKATETTKESYDLTVAQQLLETCRNYMLPWITETSLVFDFDKK